jgi:hypothetical protein
VALAALVVPTVAFASYGLATGGTSRYTLHADAQHTVVAGWSANGKVVSGFVVPTTGRGHYGTSTGRDVTHSAGAGIPNAVIARIGPDGTRYALQRFVVAGRPTELHLSRWRGAPTAVSLTLANGRLTGSVTFQGKPVTGTSPTLSGTRLRTYVYVDCFGCPANRHGWSLLRGIAPRGDGSFALALRPSWHGSRYRAEVAGPNLGATLAPDALAYAAG